MDGPAGFETTKWKVAFPLAAEAYSTLVATLTFGWTTVSTAFGLVTVGAACPALVV